jgi:ADP-ribosylglycohydrolase
MTTDGERRCGALLGLAVGDALGTTNEFKAPKAPGFPQLATGPLTKIVGGGAFGVLPGQVTDDTHMACCLYASLVMFDGFDASDVAARYVAWSAHTFDIGGQIQAALSLVKSGTKPYAAGRDVWLAGEKHPAGNGSLMRTAPIAAVLTSRDEIRAAAVADSAITHFDPRCRLACAAFDAAIACGIEGGSAADMDAAAHEELEVAARLISEEYDEDDVATAREALSGDLDLAQADDPLLYGPEIHLLKSQGFVRVAFRLAFWELAHAPDFAAALIDVANRGGDADTNAAITGALIGSRVGVDAIPEVWRATVLDCSPKDIHLSTTYHPRQFGCD